MPQAIRRAKVPVTMKLVGGRKDSRFVCNKEISCQFGTRSFDRMISHQNEDHKN